LKRDKNEKVELELNKRKETITNLESSSVALQESFDVLQKTHKHIEVQFDSLWSRTSSSSSEFKATKGSTSNAYIRSYKIIDIDACASYNKDIDHLKSIVSALEAKV
jgi:exonuclease VII small subunit